MYHTAAASIQAVQAEFGDRVIGIGFGIPFPARSPDFQPCDAYLFGRMKDCAIPAIVQLSLTFSQIVTCQNLISHQKTQCNKHISAPSSKCEIQLWLLDSCPWHAGTSAHHLIKTNPNLFQLDTQADQGTLITTYLKDSFA
jgi:hypothetical protein